MKIATGDERYESVTGVLFGSSSDAEEVIRRRFLAPEGPVNVDEKVSRLGRVGRNFVAEELTEAVVDAIGIDLAEVLGSAWRKHSKLREAARRTLDEPGMEEDVLLASHRISSVQTPQIDVLLDGVRIGTVDVNVETEFDVEGVVAKVRNGKLVSIRSGAATAKASLAIEGVEIARGSKSLNLAVDLALGEGVPL